MSKGMTSQSYGVLFNVNGVLGDSTGLEREALLAAAAEVLGTKADLRVHGSHFYIKDVMVDAFTANRCFNLLGGKELTAQTLQELDKAWAAEFYIRAKESKFEQLVGPSANEVLDRFTEEGWKLGLLTGSSKSITEIKLAFWGLENYFSWLEPSIFGAANADQALTNAAEPMGERHVYLVASSPHDVVNANQRGIYTIAISSSNSERFYDARPDQIVTSLKAAERALLG